MSSFGIWWGRLGSPPTKYDPARVGVQGTDNPMDSAPKIRSFVHDAEEFQLPTVRFSIQDDTGVLDNVIKRGVKISGQFGLNFDSQREFIESQLDQGEVKGPNNHEFNGTVLTAFGHFEGGRHVRDIAVLCSFDIPYIDSKSYPTAGATTTLLAAIKEILLEMGINADDPTQAQIQFSKMTEVLTDKTAIVRNNETSISILRRISYSKGIKFVYWDTASGPFVAMVDWDIPISLGPRLATGRYHIIDLNQNIVGDPSYDLGSGSSMGSVPYFETDAQGRQVIRFLAADEETTIQYVLNEDAVKKTANGEDAWATIQQVLSVNQFRDATGEIDPRIKKYFTAETFRTAPEQSGFQFDCQIVPDPKIHVGDLVHLGPVDEEGARRSTIPGLLKSFRGADKIPVLWRVHKSTWTHDASGVRHDIKLRR